MAELDMTLAIALIFSAFVGGVGGNLAGDLYKYFKTHAKNIIDKNHRRNNTMFTILALATLSCGVSVIEYSWGYYPINLVISAFLLVFVMIEYVKRGKKRAYLQKTLD